MLWCRKKTTTLLIHVFTAYYRPVEIERKPDNYLLSSQRNWTAYWKKMIKRFGPWYRKWSMQGDSKLFANETETQPRSRDRAHETRIFHHRIYRRVYTSCSEFSFYSPNKIVVFPWNDFTIIIVVINNHEAYREVLELLVYINTRAGHGAAVVQVYDTTFIRGL